MPFRVNSKEKKNVFVHRFDQIRTTRFKVRLVTTKNERKVYKNCRFRESERKTGDRGEDVEALFGSDRDGQDQERIHQKKSSC